MIRFEASLVIYCVFFFQAEDGIRDHCVTGVQTCALPISGVLLGAVLKSPNEKRTSRWMVTRHQLLPDRTCRYAHARGQRSEERRVGKECRSRWETDDWKIKKRDS